MRMTPAVRLRAWLPLLLGMLLAAGCDDWRNDPVRGAPPVPGMEMQPQEASATDSGVTLELVEAGFDATEFGMPVTVEVGPFSRAMDAAPAVAIDVAQALERQGDGIEDGVHIVLENTDIIEGPAGVIGSLLFEHKDVTATRPGGIYMTMTLPGNWELDGQRNWIHDADGLFIAMSQGASGYQKDADGTISEGFTTRTYFIGDADISTITVPLPDRSVTVAGRLRAELVPE